MVGKHVLRKVQPKAVAAVLVGILFVITMTQSIQASAIDPLPSDRHTGPYVDKVIYKVIPNQYQRLQALLDGQIEMDTAYYDPVNVQALEGDPDIGCYSALRHGYGQITINCRDYPLSISGLRRAFAFAFNKTAATYGIMDGYSQEHDSPIPYASGWCIEDELEWHYYDDRSDIGNQILDDLGFEINVTSGFRHAPNGDSFDIVVEVATYDSLSGQVGFLAVEALERLHIDARVVQSSYNEYVSRLDAHEEYDMWVYGQNFDTYDVSWLAYEYWSEYADVPYKNPTSFVNTTLDSWRNQLLYGTSYEEVYEAAAEMQKILHYEVPKLIVYQNTYTQGYRIDKFKDHVSELGGFISGRWTMRNIKNLDGSFGGEVPVAIGDTPDSFNIFTTDGAYSHYILENLYSSLYSLGPDLNPWPDLAVSMVTETHADDSYIEEGHTRFTIDIIQNATWSDGTPLTAYDIAFTFSYQYESAWFGNPAGDDISDLYAVYAPNPHRIVLEYTTESYWHFSSFAYDYIIPYHIFNDVDGIGYENWAFWNPVFNSGDPLVTSGPFILTDASEDEYELSRNPLYYYLASGTPQPPEPMQPTVLAVSNVSYIVGSTGNELVWEVHDDDPLRYRISLEEQLICFNPWDGSNIICNVDGLDVGVHAYTLHLYDESGNDVTNIVWVEVHTNSSGTVIDGFPLYVISIVAFSSGCLGIIVIAAVAIMRNKLLVRKSALTNN
ncbi:MAG: ABC transporter substrate-binding protein [Candidatus Thorarchaeota archaeon]